MSTQRVKTEEFMRYLLSACANAGLYGMEHQQVTRLCDESFTRLDQALSGAGSDGLLLMVVDNELILNGEPLENNLFLNRFAEILVARSIGHIRFLPGISPPEINGMIAALSNLSDKGATPEQSEHIRYGIVEVRQGSEDDSMVSDLVQQERIRLLLKNLTIEEVDRFSEIYDSVRRHQKMKISGITRIVTGFIDSFHRQGEGLMVLAALRNTDEYTFTHSTNVCILNLAQARALGIEGQQLQEIGIAAMLHDIGKLFIPEEILAKPEKLTVEEMELMKEHPVKGAKFLLKQQGVPHLAVVTAYEHHMRCDLGGYPTVTAGWQLNLCSHMTMISDFFDALRTRRPYREPMDLQSISGMMLDMMGTGFHPALARNFLRIIDHLQNESRSAG
jgi:HD-GYP domain-containing protein (c-di-GMP phosphodiesterase class II)